MRLRYFQPLVWFVDVFLDYIIYAGVALVTWLCVVCVGLSMCAMSCLVSTHLLESTLSLVERNATYVMLVTLSQYVIFVCVIYV
jgi:hypothetical protein